MHRERYTEIVTDFDFRIDLAHHLLPVAHWTVDDSQPAYRGKTVRRVEEQDGISLQKRAATRKEGKAIDRLRKYRVDNGVPPWIQMDERATIMYHRPNGPVYRSSRTVRQWADDYCASDKLLKEFVYEKVRMTAVCQVQANTANSQVVYGWSIADLRKSIEILIRSTHYTGTLDIFFRRDRFQGLRPVHQSSFPHLVEQMDQVPPLDSAPLPIHLALQALPFTWRGSVARRRRCLCDESMGSL
jgi:hypothetical protein